MGVEPIPETECARLAGFFDGEGYIGVANKAGSMALVINVSGLHHDSIARFQEAFGGRLWLAIRPNRLRARPQWVWRCYGKAAQDALATMQPYLIGKLPQLELALTFPVRPKGRAPRGRQMSVADRELRSAIEIRLKEMKREVA